MALVGASTRERMDRQFRTLERLGGHFLDVVAGSAHAEGVRAREGAGERDPRDHRALPRDRDLDAADHVPVLADPRARRDDRRRARRGRDRSAADGRRSSTCARRCSRSCSPPRRSCRCAGSAPTTTRAPRAWRPPSRCSRCSRGRRRTRGDAHELPRPGARRARRSTAERHLSRAAPSRRSTASR